MAAVVLTAVSPASASAQRWNPASPENRQVLPGFSYATIEPLLNAIGAKHQRSGTGTFKPSILATLPNGRKAALVLSSCDGAGLCKALSIQSYWTRIANSPPAETSAAIEQFNHRYAFAKAFVSPDGRPALQRYLTADYGFVRGNLAVNLLVFAAQAETFATEVLAPLESHGARPREKPTI